MKIPAPSLVRLGVAAAVAALAFGHAVHAIGQEPAYKDPKVPVDARVKDLMGRMTLEEKIGQMVQADSTWLAIPDVSKYFLGSVLSGGDSEMPDVTPTGWYAYVERVQKQALATRLGIPVLYGIDAVHGHNNVKGATVFPHNIGLGATRDPRLVEEIGRITALEVAGTGMHWAFGPCLAVPQDERWGRTYEGYGEAPELAALLGPAAVRGLQGTGLPVVASIKHYVGDGGTIRGVDQGNTEVDEATLRAVHLAGYGPSVTAGAATAMASYNSWNGQKLHGHKYLLSDVLVGELGFKGFVVSDWKAVEQLPGRFADQIERAVNAGIDMLMQPDNYAASFEELKKLAERERIPAARIDEAVRRILTVKVQMGLFEKPFGDPSLLPKVGSPEHRAVARRAVRESLVLLVNRNAALPLASSVTAITVAGKAADDIGIQTGGWTISWQGAAGATTTGTTILQGIRNAAPSAAVTYSRLGDVAKGTQAAVVVIGELPYAEMKGDRVSLELDPDDVAVVKKVKQSGVPTVVVLLSGRPMILEPILGVADAIVAAWLPGTEGDGVADVLFGKYNPTGRLSHTWPASMAQIPINVGPKGEKPKATPLFEYGFGLSYR
jgi:beta-glucosidase